MTDSLLTVLAITAVCAVFLGSFFLFVWGCILLSEVKYAKGILSLLLAISIAVAMTTFLVYQAEQEREREEKIGPCVKEETRYGRHGHQYTVCTERGKWVKTSPPAS